MAQPTSLRLMFSYVEANRHVTEKYLSDTFDPEYIEYCELDLFKSNVSLLRLLENAKKKGEMPDVFVHLLDAPALPHDIHNSPIITAAMDIDTFWWPESRIRWSLLFDYVFVWHKALVPKYQAAGHSKVIALPHAVDENVFRAALMNRERTLDVGWVGGFGYPQHERRRRVIRPLAARFKMNDIRKRYSKEETAEVYSQSRIVVNVSRDEFPPEANMRCYEGMAGGALLLTQMPTELTDWGLRPGEHFIGWKDESEVPDMVDYYLQHEKERAEIARSGQELTLREFTFQRCRDKMTAALREHPKEFFAPARKMSAKEVSLIYLEYYYRYLLLSAALEEFGILRKAGRKAYWKGLPMILKTLRQAVRKIL